jgi:hypothetical protein
MGINTLTNMKLYWSKDIVFHKTFISSIMSTGAIDESVIKFKERSSLKQYLHRKPRKKGYKVWCLCDPITVYLFNYQIYLGKEETNGE